MVMVGFWHWMVESLNLLSLYFTWVWTLLISWMHIYILQGQKSSSTHHLSCQFKHFFKHQSSCTPLCFCLCYILCLGGLLVLFSLSNSFSHVSPSCTLQEEKFHLQYCLFYILTPMYNGALMKSLKSNLPLRKKPRQLVASPVAQVVKNLSASQETKETSFNSWVGKIPWRRKWQPAPVFLPGVSHG